MYTEVKDEPEPEAEPEPDVTKAKSLSLLKYAVKIRACEQSNGY